MSFMVCLYHSDYNIIAKIDRVRCGIDNSNNPNSSETNKREMLRLRVEQKRTEKNRIELLIVNTIVEIDWKGTEEDRVDIQE